MNANSIAVLVDVVISVRHTRAQRRYDTAMTFFLPMVSESLPKGIEVIDAVSVKMR